MKTSLIKHKENLRMSNYDFEHTNQNTGNVMLSIQKAASSVPVKKVKHIDVIGYKQYADGRIVYCTVEYYVKLSNTTVKQNKYEIDRLVRGIVEMNKAFYGVEYTFEECHDALIASMIKLEEFRYIGKFHYSVVNTELNRYRTREQKRQPIFSVDNELDTNRSMNEIQGNLIAEEIIALCRVGDKESQLIDGRLTGSKVKDVADNIGITPSNLSTKRHKLLKQVKKLMNEDQDDIQLKTAHAHKEQIKSMLKTKSIMETAQIFQVPAVYINAVSRL